MAKDLSGLKWPEWPIAGAVIAGRRDELPAPAEGFALTPSGQAEQDAAYPPQEVPDAGSESSG